MLWKKKAASCEILREVKTVRTAIGPFQIHVFSQISLQKGLITQTGIINLIKYY